MFPLCRTCVETKQQSPCRHNDEQRALQGTWVSDEILKSLSIGYKVIEIHSVWHFDQKEQYDPASKTGGLFSEYINTFLKLKQESSGFPSWCSKPEDVETYVREYYEREGILLDKSKIEKNPGLRALAKLMLNSFWGKFGQRLNMPETAIIHEPAKLYELLQAKDTIINNINFINDDVAEVKFHKIHRP